MANWQHCIAKLTLRVTKYLIGPGWSISLALRVTKYLIGPGWLICISPAGHQVPDRTGLVDLLLVLELELLGRRFDTALDFFGRFSLEKIIIDLICETWCAEREWRERKGNTRIF